MLADAIALSDQTPGTRSLHQTEFDLSSKGVVYVEPGLSCTFFEDLYRITTDENPATKQQYVDLFNQLKIEKEVKVFREGRITWSKDIRPGDIIIKAKDKPLWIPGLPDKFNSEQ